MSQIQWTNETWNPVVGCSPVSEGCRHCYAARHALRLAGNPHEQIASAYVGTAEMRGLGSKRRAVFTGRVNLLPDRLEEPLRWRRPRRVFVNSMSDLFHEAVPFEFIDRVFAVMAMAPQHTFQILTKRPERMAEYCNDTSQVRRDGRGHAVIELGGITDGLPWPLPNVWLGTSVEDQAAAEERIPHLLRTPAAVRFLSCEPLLDRVDVSRWLVERRRGEIIGDGLECLVDRPRIDWVIVGGESGPGARPCDIAWIRWIVEQGRAAGVPVFVKQLGAWPYEKRPAQGGAQGTEEALANLGAPHPQRRWFRDCWTLTHSDRSTYWLKLYNLRDRKGGDPAEWPEDLRVREFPRGR